MEARFGGLTKRFGGAAALVLAISGPVAASTTYEFRKIVESTGTPFESVRGAAAINGDGIVAYWDHEALYTDDHGLKKQIIAADSTPYSSISFYPSINDSGVLGFGAFPIAGDWAILASDGSSTEVLVDDVAGDLSSIGSSTTINDNRVVAGWAKTNSGIHIVYSSDGDVFDTIADTSAVYSTLLVGTAINDAGTVAYRGYYAGGSEVATGDDTSSTTIADTSGEFSGFNLGDIAINENGAVAFRASIDGGGEAVAVGDASGTTIVADTAGGFDSFYNGGFDGVSLNDENEVAFWGSAGGVAGIYTGANASIDKVLGVGDELQGDTVIALFIGDEALNNAGEIVFTASLERSDGSQYRSVYVAVPVDRTTASIDIRPRRATNWITPTSPHVVPVAILGSESLDVLDVDVTTLAFGPDAASPTFDLTTWWVFLLSYGDVNDDGFKDLVSYYRPVDSGIAMGDAEACLTGETLDGIPFKGCDAILTGPACGYGFEAVLVLPPLVWMGSRQRRRLRAHRAPDSPVPREGKAGSTEQAPEACYASSSGSASQLSGALSERSR